MSEFRAQLRALRVHSQHSEIIIRCFAHKKPFAPCSTNFLCGLVHAPLSWLTLCAHMGKSREHEGSVFWTCVAESVCGYRSESIKVCIFSPGNAKMQECRAWGGSLVLLTRAPVFLWITRKWTFMFLSDCILLIFL